MYDLCDFCSIWVVMWWYFVEIVGVISIWPYQGSSMNYDLGEWYKISWCCQLMGCYQLMGFRGTIRHQEMFLLLIIFSSKHHPRDLNLLSLVKLGGLVINEKRDALLNNMIINGVLSISIDIFCMLILAYVIKHCIYKVTRSSTRGEIRNMWHTQHKKFETNGALIKKMIFLWFYLM